MRSSKRTRKWFGALAVLAMWTSGCVEGLSFENDAATVDDGFVNTPQSPGPSPGQEGSACAKMDDCSEPLQCILGAQGALCILPCTSDAQCTSGACLITAGTEAGYCSLGPARPDTAPPGEADPQGPSTQPTLSTDGSACTSDAQCAGGTCQADSQGYPGGHCTTEGCQTSDDCSDSGAACLNGEPTRCVRLCQDEVDCRPGYECLEVSGGAYCSPLDVQQPDPSPETDPDEIFDTLCGSTLAQSNAYQGYDRHDLSFEIPQGTTSYMVVPYAQNNGQIFSVQLDGPGGQLDMFGDYDFANANAGFLINLVPTLVPAAPQFQNFVRPGSHTLTMAANTNLCRVVHKVRGQGTRIDLNIHLVGVSGLSASTAPNNNQFQQALQRFESIYSQQGVSLGQVRYSDVTGANRDRYRIIRADEETFDLVSLSQSPGPTADDALSINVFFIDQFAIEGGSVLGISAGLPGAAGLHGTRGSGLVFSASVMDDANLLGQVLAHEVGHFLGLFHTSEQQGEAFDPIQDTAQCASQRWNNPDSCPDINNLMFPFAGQNHTEISAGQAAVLRANPLVK